MFTLIRPTGNEIPNRRVLLHNVISRLDSTHKFAYSSAVAVYSEFFLPDI